MAEADRHIEEEMEAERKRAEEMAEQRKARAAEYTKSYRYEYESQFNPQPTVRPPAPPCTRLMNGNVILSLRVELD